MDASRNISLYIFVLLDQTGVSMRVFLKSLSEDSEGPKNKEQNF